MVSAIFFSMKFIDFMSLGVIISYTYAEIKHAEKQRSLQRILRCSGNNQTKKKKQKIQASTLRAPVVAANRKILSARSESGHQPYQKTSACQTTHRPQWRYHPLYSFWANGGTQHGNAQHYLCRRKIKEHEFDCHRTSAHQIRILL